MSRATIECWSSKNGMYLNNGTCFEGQLLASFIHWGKEKDNEEWYIILTKEVESRKEERHVQDILHNIFDTNVDIDFDFANNLKLYDTITSDCLMPISDLGKAIIELCIYSNLIFIVSRKFFLKKDYLTIDFEACTLDYNREGYDDIIANKILD